MPSESNWKDCFVKDLLKEFPGLEDGETEVNGGDLVEWITNYLQQWREETDETDPGTQ